MTRSSGSAQFGKLRDAFAADPSLRRETERAFLHAVEEYNPSDHGLRFITGGIGEWLITFAAYQAGVVTLPDGHDAVGYDTADILAEARALWSVKTSYSDSNSYSFTITNGQGGAGQGLVVPTIFLAPGLPGIVYADPELHPDLAVQVQSNNSDTKLKKSLIAYHASLRPECVIPFDMPVNPGRPYRDPGLEAVRLILSPAQFPRLTKMLRDVETTTDTSVVGQIQALAKLKTDGLLSEDDYRAAVRLVTES